MRWATVTHTPPHPRTHTHPIHSHFCWAPLSPCYRAAPRPSPLSPCYWFAPLPSPCCRFAPVALRAATCVPSGFTRYLSVGSLLPAPPTTWPRCSWGTTWVSTMHPRTQTTTEVRWCCISTPTGCVTCCRDHPRVRVLCACRLPRGCTPFPPPPTVIDEEYGDGSVSVGVCGCEVSLHWIGQTRFGSGERALKVLWVRL
jgi:hypothetical protein